MTMRVGMLLWWLVAWAGQAAQSGPTNPPHILLALADDWGLHAGVYGTQWIKTPTFDRVAREGLLFTRAYTPNAKCAPSRASILTGRNPWQLKAAANHICYIPTEFKSWPEALAEHGWFVGYTQKGWAPGVATNTAGQPRQLTGRAFNRRKATPPATGISNNDYAANFEEFLDAGAVKRALENELIAELKQQGDPRVFGQGEIFDQYAHANPGHAGFYERFMRGERLTTGWARPTDFEKAPLQNQNTNAP